MQALQCVGSRLDAFACPRCGAHDRERHLLLYLQSIGMAATIRHSRVLHFAPERRLPDHIQGMNPARYVRCDLYPSTEGIERVDLLDMPFDPESFDVVIANHVLEHVRDDRKALVEIARVLRPGGCAILQTPYSSLLAHTWEDEAITTPATRLQAYGQEDHVRLYGRDIFHRLEYSGLKADIRAHADCLPEVDPDQSGVNAAEPLFLYWKPERREPPGTIAS